MNEPDATLGIDISKATFHAFLVSPHGEAKKSFPNAMVGFSQLQAWLRNRGVVRAHACMEATGSYWEALAAHLHEAGHAISIVNPRRIKAYAESRLSRAKTDAVDAALIARFALVERPKPWEPPAPEIKTLQAFSRHLEFLKAARAEHLTRIQTPGLPTYVVASTTTIIQAFDSEICDIERAIRDHIDRHPKLKAKHDLLVSIPGIGEATGNAILAEMPTIAEFGSARAVAAFAGLSPKTFESGSSVRGKSRICKTGNSRLRKLLYLPAVVAKKHNPVLRAFAERLLAAGKAPMLVIGALMRKLLVMAYGVLKSGRPFSPDYAGAGA